MARRAVFIPRTMGIFIFLIIILAFTAGAVRQELAPVLAAAVFLALWVYCLLLTLFLALIHNRRARRAFIRLSPREVSVGELVEIIYSEGEAAPRGRIFQLPGILVRCRLLLSSGDGRHIRHDFNPGGLKPYYFTAKKRGAYFSAYNEFAVFDILGFFRFAFRIYVESGPQLLVCPHAADEPPSISAHHGDSNLKPEFSFQRSDNLIDHRPYVPGDDPRRINWKLYGHSGGLFVRDEEREPPPQSNIIILINTEYDPLLYRIPAARHGIDMLCEYALAAAFACMESGMNVLTGYSDASGRAGTVIRGGKAEIAMSLAWPAALPLSASAEMPDLPDDYGVIVLALPRSSAESSILDRFLNAVNRTKKDKPQIVELLFFCGDSGGNVIPGENTVIHSERLAAAEVCAALYNKRPGVRARMFDV
jgi:uncharacterized protein (DUF58 family)